MTDLLIVYACDMCGLFHFSSILEFFGVPTTYENKRRQE